MFILFIYSWVKFIFNLFLKMISQKHAESWDTSMKILDRPFFGKKVNWRVAQRRNNYDFGENEIFTSNWPGDKGASFGTIKFSKNLLIKYIISIFNLNAFMRELGRNICSFERPLPLLFFSKQKLVWLLKEALNLRREAAPFM